MITTVESADAAQTAGDFVGGPGRSESSACAVGVDDSWQLDQLVGRSKQHSRRQATIDGRRGPAAPRVNRHRASRSCQQA